MFLGLLLHRAILYLTSKRNRRELYHGGLFRLAEHMHFVTRSMSNDPDNMGDSGSMTKGVNNNDWPDLEHSKIHSNFGVKIFNFGLQFFWTVVAVT